jgi:hypothetical protein
MRQDVNRRRRMDITSPVDPCYFGVAIDGALRGLPFVPDSRHGAAGRWTRGFGTPSRGFVATLIAIDLGVGLPREPVLRRRKGHGGPFVAVGSAEAERPTWMFLTRKQCGSSSAPWPGHGV